MRSGPTNDEASILSRAIDAGEGSWSASVAQGVLSIKLAPGDRARMNELAAKAQNGELSPDEELEVESYRQVCRLLDLMKAKARASLKNAGPSAA